MDISLRVPATVALVTFAGANAQAHERWADNIPVPAWVKRQCCGPGDAHHLQPSQVHVTPTGYKVDGYGDVIPQNRLAPSPDGEWWVFYRVFGNGAQSPVYCFFGPPQGS